MSGVHLRVLQHLRMWHGQHPLHPSGEWSVSHTACTPASLCGQLTDSVCARVDVYVIVCGVQREKAVFRHLH